MSVVTRFPANTEADGSTPLMSSPANIKVQDNTGATFTFDPPLSIFTGSVRTYDYGFQSVIPDGSGINTVKAILRFKFPTGGTTGSSGVGYTIRTYVNGVAQSALFSPSPRGADLYSSYINEVIDLTPLRTWTLDDLVDGTFKITAEFNFNGITGTVDADSLSVQVDYTPGSDSGPPNLQSAVVDGAALVLIYNELVVDGSGTATVRVNGSVRSFTPSAASGSTKILTLSSPVISSDVVLISYPLGYVKDGSNNLAAAKTNQSVVNATGDVTVPTLTTKVIDFDTLTLIYSEAVKNGSGSATIKVNGVSKPYTTSAPSGSAKVFTMSVPIASTDTITISYPAGFIKDLAGNNAAAQTDAAVTNNTPVDTTAPTRVSAVLDFTQLVLTFSEYVVNGSGSATVKVNGSSVSITESPASGTTKTIVVSSGTVNTDTVTVSYPAGYVKDVAGNNIASATDAAVSNVTNPPSSIPDIDVEDFVYFGDTTPVHHEFHAYASDSGGDSVFFNDFDGVHKNEFPIVVEDFWFQFGVSEQITGNFPKTFTITETLASNFFKETLRVMPDPYHVDETIIFADIGFATTDDHTDFTVLDTVFLTDRPVTVVLEPNPFQRNIGDTFSFIEPLIGVQRGQYISETIIFIDTPCINLDIGPTVSDTLLFADAGVFSINAPSDPRNYTPLDDVGGFTLTAPIRKRISEAFGFAEYTSLYDSDGNLVFIDPCHPRLPVEEPDLERTINESWTITEAALPLFIPSWRNLSEAQWRDLSVDEWEEVLEDQSSVPDLPTQAAYISTDTTIKGTWIGNYGHDGYIVVVDSTPVDSLPDNITISGLDNEIPYTWSFSSAASIDLASYTQDPLSLGQRMATTFYNIAYIEFNVTIRDRQTKYMTLHIHDFDNAGRSYDVEIYDSESNTLLVTHPVTIAEQQASCNVTFEVYGSLRIKLNKTAGDNVVLAGIYFDPTADDIRVSGLRYDLNPVAGSIENQAVPMGEVPTGTAPTIESNIINGLPVYHFTAHGLTLHNIVTRFASAMTAFVVVRRDISPPAAGADSGLWHIGNAGADTHFPFTDNLIYEAFGTNSRKNGITPGIDLAAQYQVYELVADTNFYEIRLNGTLIYSDTTNVFGKPTNAIFGKSESLINLVARVARFLFYTRRLSPSERTAIRNLLMDIYQ